MHFKTKEEWFFYYLLLQGSMRHDIDLEHGILTIKQTQMADAGTYKCVANTTGQSLVESQGAYLHVKSRSDDRWWRGDYWTDGFKWPYSFHLATKGLALLSLVHQNTPKALGSVVVKEVQSSMYWQCIILFICNEIPIFLDRTMPLQPFVKYTQIQLKFYWDNIYNILWCVKLSFHFFFMILYL